MSYIDEDDEYRKPRERELTLGTGTILGIFFGLVILCGLFFGFGYNMGARTRPVPPVADQAAVTAPATNFGSFSKPAAGSYNAPGSHGTPTTKPPTSSPAPATAEPIPAPIVRQPPAEEATGRTPQRPQPVTITPSAHPAAAPPPPAPSAPVATGPGTFMVQVAAVSHQEDAQLLVGALRSRGYTVAAHTAPGDTFYHVQVGPFSNKKDAEAMRQRLLGDGYNAVLK